MSANTNALNWFEIPALDIARAKKYYQEIFQIEMQEVEMMGMKMAMFPSDSSKVSGALVQMEGSEPSTKGTVVYLNGHPDLQLVLDRIEAAGGTITMPKTLISEDNGYMAFMLDTEGNNVGLHSMQ